MTREERKKAREMQKMANKAQRAVRMGRRFMK
jgi:hypothetical protein